MSFDEIKAFLKTVWVDDADNTYLHNGRLVSDNYNEFNENIQNEMEDFYYFKDMVNGKLELNELIEGRSKSIYQHKRSANEYIYTKMLNEVADFSRKDIDEFEKILLEIEKEIFEKKEFDDEKIENESDEFNKILKDAYGLEIQSHDMILSTCVATSIGQLPKLDIFNQLIIDEAGMTKEPEALIPVVLCSPRRVVLIGDHKQLRSIVKSRQAAALGLEKSIFERYCDKAIILEEQYRMHESICHFSSTEFYEGWLRTPAENKKIECTAI